MIYCRTMTGGISLPRLSSGERAIDQLFFIKKIKKNKKIQIASQT